MLPVKNGMPYILETLKSIETQTYRNWEILCWDNGSDDGTLQELYKLIPSRLPGRVISNQPLGLGDCLAKMVEMAETELCARIDADDVNLPDRLSKQVEYMMDHPEVGVLGTQIQLIDENGFEKPGAWILPCEDAEMRWRIRFASTLMHPTVIFRRSVILKAGNYQGIVPGQDYDLWLRVAMISKISNLPQRLVKYRHHPLSLSNVTKIPGLVTNLKLVAKYRESLFPGFSENKLKRLYYIINENYVAPTNLTDILILRQAVSKSASAMGESESYFRKTNLYRLQQQSLLVRWFKNLPIISVVWNWLKSFRQKNER